MDKKEEEANLEKSTEDILYKGDSSPDIEGGEKVLYIKKPSRTIVVEPVMFLLTLFGFPMHQVSQLFVYGKIKDYVIYVKGYNESLIDAEMNNSTCNVNKSSFEYQFTQEIQTYNTYFSMIGSSVWAIPSLLVVLFLGAYSDKAGRKYALVPPIIGSFIYSGIYLVTVLFDLPLWCIWIAELAEGLGGGMSLLFTGCFSYIADITTKEQRQFRIVIAELAMFFVGILGPIGVGYWIKSQGYDWPVIVSFCGHIINLIYVIFFVPETIIKQPNVKFFTLAHIKHGVNVIMKQTLDKRRWKIWVLLLSFVIHRLGSGSYSIGSLFELNIPLCWGAVTIGYYSTLTILVSTIGGIIASKTLKCCMSDAGIALTSAVVLTFNNIYKGFVKNTVMMFASCVFFPFAMLLTPTTRALLSTLVEDNEQGAMFSAVAVFEHITELFSSEAFKFLYTKTLYITPGFVFFIGAIFYFVVACIFVFYIVKLRREKPLYQQLENIE